MNRIEKLIAELCPNGVEWKKLGEVCVSLKKDTLKLTDLIPNGKYPVINSGREWYGRYNSYNNEGNALTIAARGEYAGYINYINEKFWAGGLCYPYRSKDENLILTKYIFYALKAHENIIMQTLVSRGSIPALNKIDIANLPIPIPPLPIQEEIVKILDTFTALQAELQAALQAELEARKKQYEYYRNKLLTPVEQNGKWYLNGKEVEWKKLGEVCEFMNGKGHEKYIDENGRFIVVNSKFISTDGKIKKYSAKQISPVYKYNILMVMSDLPNGKALAKCFYVDENDKYTLNQRICALTIKNFNLLNPKFLLYILNRNKQLLKYDNGVDQTNLRKDDILKISIPIPPLSEQERIVAILDKLDALVNDLSVALPAEIEARRKQYEYYRNKLLNFRGSWGNS